MELPHGVHLAYCTNIHPAETWAETLAALERCTLKVRDAVGCQNPGRPFGIGLRLGDTASRELAQPEALGRFRGWLERNRCYVFTINGFPYGQFHGKRVKEQVYRPDWSTPERLGYTRRLLAILAGLLDLAPAGCEGSVSTLPVSFKAFGLDASQRRAAVRNLWECVDQMETLSAATGRALHLGLEPEPLCTLETTAETVAFFEELAAERPGDARWRNFLGVNFDVCHLACEYEEPRASFAALRAGGIRVSKIHLSSALRVRPTPAAREALKPFTDDVYLHQVIAGTGSRRLRAHLDLADALQAAPRGDETEWRVHFHVPLHMEEGSVFGTTAAANLQALECLAADPALCRHLEMETYTWGVLPAALRSRNVVDQLAAEYAWCLAQWERLIGK
ncbi:MAG: metabolite traffic protein EboE [Chthoniobacteraceae bacterium]|nr:metabolite traffic protein EboE [Chthoniobacteraceae bacterium]